VPPRRQSTPRSPEHAALGEAIRLARVERGLSQEALVDAAGVHITVLGDVERGVGNPNYETLLRLARALGVAPGAIVARADELAAAARSEPG
jgi:transcriptional regulator with XRE-family HTH domain